MNLDKFTIKAQEAIADSEKTAREYGNQQIEPEHILASLLENPEGVGQAILRKYGVPVERFKIKSIDPK